jgi:hypothetical protein
MRTAEEIINQFWKDAPDVDRLFSSVLVIEAMKAYAKECCKEQRDICADVYAQEAFHENPKIEEKLLNAPSPEMK